MVGFRRCLLEVLNAFTLYATIYYLCLAGFLEAFVQFFINGYGGTLYQLRNLIQHRNVANHPKNSFTACEDFLVLVAEAHVVAAALKILDVFCGGFSLP